MKQIMIPDELIARSRSNQEIIDLVIEQVNKDFVYAGFEAPLELNYNYNALLERLSTSIIFLLNQHHHRFISMLYRIDVPDHIIMFALDPSETKSTEQRFAEIIFERNLLKVLTRKYYSNK